MKCGAMFHFHANKCGVSKRNKQLFISPAASMSDEYCPKCKDFHLDMVKTLAPFLESIEGTRSVIKKETFQQMVAKVGKERIAAAGKIEKTNTLNDTLVKEVEKYRQMQQDFKDDPQHALWREGGWLEVVQ
jgi:hypothetical protein